MAYTVNALPDYVEQNRLPLLAAAVLKGKTVEVINRQSGIKGKAALNIVDVTAPFQAGKTCGFNASGNDTFSQRVIETVMVKVEKEWCWKDLIGKWAEYEYRVVAGEKTLAFEEFFLNEVAKKIAAEIETIIWQGSVTPAITGLLGHLTAASVSGTAFTATDDYKRILEVYAAIPEAVLDDAVIFVSAARFRGFVQGLVAANLYHYDPSAPVDEVIIPGTNTRVIKVNGLNGSTYGTVSDVVVAADPMNLFYGYDVEDSAEALDVWYSKDNDSIRLRMTTNIGTQVAFPNEVVVMGN